MRLYHFSHFMLSTMAKGIQNTHSATEIPLKYQDTDFIKLETFYDWAKNHKTIISLNGGVSPDLDNLKFQLQDPENPYPWSEFYEDESLGKLMTSISIVLPEKIYEMSALFRTRNFEFTDDGYVRCLDTAKVQEMDLIQIANFGRYSIFERILVEVMNNYRLAS